MNFFLFFIAAVFIIAIIVSTTQANNNKNTLNEYAINGYDFENELDINLHTIAVDTKNEKLLIIKPYATTPINQQREILLNFEDIIGFEISRNGETITKASIGAPIVGGIIFGVGGALIGSILGNRKTIDNMMVDLNIQLKSFDNPIVKFPIIANSTPQIAKRRNLEELEKLCVWFKLILDKNESKSVSS